MYCAPRYCCPHAGPSRLFSPPPRRSRPLPGSAKSCAARSMSSKPSHQDLRDRSQLDTCNYGDASYWDKRYTRDSTPFDWYQSYSGISPLFRKFIPTSSRVLVVGCGNAVMSEDMVADGYQEIINIDISPVVIDAMQKKYFNIPELEYMRMDVQDLSYFDDGTFDAIIDKGTLDSLMCGMNAQFCAASMLAEVSRVLKPEGVFLLITYGDPRSRLPHLNRKEYCWTISLYVLPQPESKRASEGCSRTYLEPVVVTCDDSHAIHFVPDDHDAHFVYACIKVPSLQWE